MGVPTSEVGYTSATDGRGDHEVHKGHVVALGKNMHNSYLSWIGRVNNLYHRFIFIMAVSYVLCGVQFESLYTAEV
jgi:hypothetical protein